MSFKQMTLKRQHNFCLLIIIFDNPFVPIKQKKKVNKKLKRRRKKIKKKEEKKRRRKKTTQTTKDADKDLETEEE